VLAVGRVRDRGLNNSAAAASVLILNRFVDTGAAHITSAATIELEPARIVASVRLQLAELFTAQAAGEVKWVRAHFAR
jgi:hypothetical protein